MQEEENEEFQSLSSNAKLYKLEGGKDNEYFDQNLVLVDLSPTQRLDNIFLNDVVPNQVDTEVTSMSNTKMVTRRTFQHLYYETLYSLYPNLFVCPSVMLLIDDIFAKCFSTTNSLKVQYDNKMYIKMRNLMEGNC